MRREHDFYPTPAWATRELLKRVSIYGEIWEPCSGAGDMARELERGKDRKVYRNDIDTSRIAFTHGDATDHAWWRRLDPKPNWVVTNPPFNVADKILPLAVRYSRRGVAMLLRISYLEPCKGRGGWLAKHPPNHLIVLPRISFTGDGGKDTATCAWMVWKRSDHMHHIEIVTPKDERQPSVLEATA